jgi:hypothetical protein
LHEEDGKYYKFRSTATRAVVLLLLLLLLPFLLLERASSSSWEGGRKDYSPSHQHLHHQ